MKHNGVKYGDKIVGHNKDSGGGGGSGNSSSVDGGGNVYISKYINSIIMLLFHL